MKCSRIINILRSVFSVDVGLSESDAQRMLKRMLSDPEQRLNIERELVYLYQNDSVSWMLLLDNEEYVVYPADDETDAKGYLTSILWDQVFPGNEMTEEK
ncbi:hypothetical protein I1A_003091 [Pseudomonas fluorescens R124]|uniref:Uncharacterized protein n=1 Tax=Pseudomonas fluorescens R124 TaxID=743713 RepID=A0A7U9CS54_PSEFL|nr:hypothetical protein I1A_003091 [Pseudomonas fluorescens R124]